MENCIHFLLLFVSKTTKLGIYDQYLINALLVVTEHGIKGMRLHSG